MLLSSFTSHTRSGSSFAHCTACLKTCKGDENKIGQGPTQKATETSRNAMFVSNTIIPFLTIYLYFCLFFLYIYIKIIVIFKTIIPPKLLCSILSVWLTLLADSGLPYVRSKLQYSSHTFPILPYPNFVMSSNIVRAPSTLCRRRTSNEAYGQRIEND